MKSQHLHKLSELELERQKIAYPNIPDHCRAITKWSDKTANGLEKCICKFLTLSGHQAERIKNQGRMIDNSKVVQDTLGRSRTIGSKKYIPGTGTNGTSDISSTIRGLSVKWEIKMKDKQSEAQKEYQLSIERAGGKYFIVHSFDEFYNYYEGLFHPKTNAPTI